MIVSSDPDYFDTKLVKQGKKQLEPDFQELADWISEKFRIKPLNIYYDKIEVDKNRPRLNIIFEYYDSVSKFRDKIGNYDSVKQKMIAEKFRQILADEASTIGNYFSRLFKKVEHPTYDTNKLLVIFGAFEPIAREEANGEMANGEWGCPESSGIRRISCTLQICWHPTAFSAPLRRAVLRLYFRFDRGFARHAPASPRC